MGGGDGNTEQGRDEQRRSAAGLRVSLVMRNPMVRTIRQPPIRVPSAIDAWQASTTQNGTEKTGPR